jgi:4-diphosphocytidyl-2-C-methyl-D-erythritol kinase
VTATGKCLGDPAPWPAPAKLNLCLRIVGRRTDGYHLLQTAFQFIDLADQLAFYGRPPGVIERIGGVVGIASADDLTVRAAAALYRRVSSPDLPGVAIAIEKRIPIGGGLGGGSSDAATVLVALNRLLGLGLASDELAAIGLELGADVPVFVHGRSAWAEGIGERLTDWDWPLRDFVVVDPGVSVATAAVFQAPELTRNSPVTTIRDFLTLGGGNDAAPIVRANYREVAEVFDFLEEFGAPKLTGTGACVFVEVPGADAANRVLAALPAHWRGYAVHALNRSPLLARVAREPVGH